MEERLVLNVPRNVTMGDRVNRMEVVIVRKVTKENSAKKQSAVRGVKMAGNVYVRGFVLVPGDSGNLPVKVVAILSAKMEGNAGGKTNVNAKRVTQEKTALLRSVGASAVMAGDV